MERVLEDLLCLLQLLLDCGSDHHLLRSCTLRCPSIAPYYFALCSSSTSGHTPCFGQLWNCSTDASPPSATLYALSETIDVAVVLPASGCGHPRMRDFAELNSLALPEEGGGMERALLSFFEQTSEKAWMFLTFVNPYNIGKATCPVTKRQIWKHIFCNICLLFHWLAKRADMEIWQVHLFILIVTVLWLCYICSDVLSKECTFCQEKSRTGNNTV